MEMAGEQYFICKADELSSDRLKKLKQKTRHNIPKYAYVLILHGSNQTTPDYTFNRKEPLIIVAQTAVKVRIRWKIFEYAAGVHYVHGAYNKRLYAASSIILFVALSILAYNYFQRRHKGVILPQRLIDHLEQMQDDILYANVELNSFHPDKNDKMLFVEPIRHALYSRKGINDDQPIEQWVRNILVMMDMSKVADEELLIIIHQMLECQNISEKTRTTISVIHDKLIDRIAKH